MKQIIASPHAPAAIGPYSQGVLCQGTFAFISGQLPIDPDTGKFPGDDIRSQTEQSLKNVEALLREGGMGFEDVVDVSVLLTDINDFSAMNEVYAKYFHHDCPARCAFEISALPKAAKVEVRVTACK